MNIEYFYKYISYEYNGVKTRPKLFLNKFILSFANYKEKESWTIEYLPLLERYFDNYIPNELFEEIIFPVLSKYIHTKEYKKYLIKFGKTFYRNKKVWWELGYELRKELIEEFYELEPDNDEIIDVYLEFKIDMIKWALHHWPDIIVGTLEECKEMLEEIPFIHKLDRNKIYQEYISDFEIKLKKWLEKNNGVRPNVV